jgi:hypothetical protein
MAPNSCFPLQDVATVMNIFLLMLALVVANLMESLTLTCQAMFQIEVTTTEKETMKLLDGVDWYQLEAIKKLENCWPEITMYLFEDKVEPYASYEITSNYNL